MPGTERALGALFDYPKDPDEQHRPICRHKLHAKECSGRNVALSIPNLSNNPPKVYCLIVL